MLKQRLKRPQCSGKGPLVINGSMRYKGKVIKCTGSSKQVSGNNIKKLVDNQLRSWERKVQLVMSITPAE